MTEIAVIEHMLLAATLLVPALARLFQRNFFQRLPTAALFFLCCLAVYALIVTRVHVIDSRLEAALYSFDLDRDGSFSEDETTPDQVRAMRAWSGDTARALAPYTGIVLAPLIVGFAFFLVAAVKRSTAFARNRIARRRSLRTD